MPPFFVGAGQFSPVSGAAPPPGFHLRRRGRIPQKAGQAIATLRFPLQSAARHRQSHLRAPPLAIASLHAGAVRGAAGGGGAHPPPPHPPPPPRPRASTDAGGGAYPKSHRVKLLPQKRKKVANCHFFAMRYP